MDDAAQKRSDGSQQQIYQDEENMERTRANSLGKSKFLNKFRRSISINNNELDLSQNLENKPKSTFYITEIIDPDANNGEQVKNESSAVTKTSSRRQSRTMCQRPQSPPPPIPVDASQTIGKFMDHFSNKK